MSEHHSNTSHTHNFINKHTAFALLVLIAGSFFAGYFVGTRHQEEKNKDKKVYTPLRTTEALKYDNGGRFNPDDLSS